MLFRSCLLKGFSSNCYTVFNDRGEALRKALKEAIDNDIVIVLGKGRENYQDIKNEKVPYSDVEIILEYANAD